jgi:hypothetical protein
LKRAKIILATADGYGTKEIMRRSELSKPVNITGPPGLDLCNDPSVYWAAIHRAHLRPMFLQRARSQE